MKKPAFLITTGLLTIAFATVVVAKMTMDDSLRSNNYTDREQVMIDVLSLPADAPLDNVDETFFRMPLYDEYSSVRVATINVLKHRNIKTFNDDLVILLREGSPIVRAAAAEALSILGDKNKVTLPLWRSLQDGDEIVRSEVIQGLDRLHKTKFGFYYDQSAEKYRLKAQKEFKQYLKIPKYEEDSHAAKIYGINKD